MIGDNETVLAVIPARGGSKGLPRKNVLPLGGRPLIAWSIEIGLATPRIDRLVVSSDDAEILAAARAAGCPDVIERPAALAGDGVTTEPVLLHAAEAMGGGFDWILLLQPTSPFRSVCDVTAVLDMAETGGGDTVVSVCETPKSPFWSFSLEEENRLSFLFSRQRPSSQRQQLPKVYVPNGALYCGRTRRLAQTSSYFGGPTRGYVMPPERSVDIDSELDLLYAQLMLDNGLVKPPMN